MHDLVSRQLGPYEIREYVGAGGMATVYKAYHAALDRFVAVKVLSPAFARDEGFLERFKQEAQVIAKFRHPSIVQVHDFQSEGDPIYIVMEYVGGGSLKERLGEPLDLEVLLQIAVEVTDALSYAHQRSIVHRDIKPGNILLDDQGHALLSDFGLAKKLESSSQLTEPGIALGTPDYAAPEQFQGGDVDARSDIYALGATLYEMATGRVPFAAETGMDVAVRHITEPVQPPRELNPDMPVALEQVILKAMAKEPSDRYQSARDIQQALQGVRDREMEKRRLQELEPLYSQGVKYMEDKEWQKALETFLELIERDPQFRDVEEKRAEVERQIELEALYHRGLECLAQRDWLGAIRFFMQVTPIDADFKDVSAQLEEASRQQRLEIVYSEGLSHFRRRRWSRAREKFDEVLAEAPGYQEADRYLKEAKEQEQLAEWYAEAQEHLRRENWQQAIRCLRQVGELNSDYKDARAKLDLAQDEYTLQELYQDGMRHFGQRSWQDAKGHFDKILGMRPDGYRDTRKKLEEVDKQLRLAAQLEEALKCESDEEWTTAIGIYVGILTEDTGYPEVAERLARAQKEEELLKKYRQAERHLDGKEWIAAIEALNWVVDRRADYQDAEQKLQLAKDKEEAKASYREGLEHFGRGEWRQAAEKLERVVQLDPGNKDAAKKLKDAKRNERIAALYGEGMEYLRSRQWQKAIQRFEQVIDADPDHQRASALLEDAKKQRQEQTQATRQGVNLVRRWGLLVIIVLGVLLLLIFLPGLFTETRQLNFGSLLVTPEFVGALAGVFSLTISIITLLIPTERLYELLERDQRLKACVFLLLLLMIACLLTPLVMGLVRREESTPDSDKLCNGSFEDRYNCWEKGGNLKKMIECEAGQCFAVLGNPDYSCEGGVPVGEAWIKQSFKVPETISPTLSLSYRIFSYDLDSYDFFQVSIDGDPVFQDGNTEWDVSSCNGEVWDSNQRSWKFDLSPYIGKRIELSLRNVNGEHEWYNTWTYVDDVEVH